MPKSVEEMLRQATFLRGAPTLKALPDDDGIEVAFAGRSNAGKSSAINTITGRRALARTSRTPGRTQEINFFELPATEDDGPPRRLVDLPGYGFAKVALDVRLRWQQVMHRFLETRQGLRGLMLVVDCRRDLSVEDQQLLDWSKNAALPVHVLLTKADKLSRNQGQQALAAFRRTAGLRWPEAEAQLFSSLKRDGLDIARARLAKWLEFETGGPD